MPTLFDPITLGDYQLQNRIFMAPMTRGRSGEDGIPNNMVAEYYAQRATAGLLITEATAINELGDGWPGAPGIYTDAQQEGWRKVADAVHAQGGRIFMQIWHMGRTVLPENLNGERPVAPSEIPAAGEIPNREGKPTPFAVPRALTVPEIEATVADFAKAAERAVAAGIDGVEIHAANNFLIDAFLRDGTNQRDDKYGGSVENRARFLLEIVEAAVKAIGAGKVGVRLSPTNGVFGIRDSQPEETFPQVAAMLNKFNLAYLHVLEAEPESGHPMATDQGPVTALIREAYEGTFIVNAGFDEQSGEQVLNSQEADAVAFGVPFIANPDLVERFRKDAPLAAPDQATFYTPGPEGYTDYPTYLAKAS